MTLRRVMSDKGCEHLGGFVFFILPLLMFMSLKVLHKAVVVFIISSDAIKLFI